MSKATEHGEQAAVIEWCLSNLNHYPLLHLIYAVPNGAMLGGGRIGAIRMNYLKAEGLRPGVSDLCLPVPRGVFHGAYFEMKTMVGSLHKNQEEFIDAIEQLGYFAPVCWGADDAIGNIQWYMNLGEFKFERKSK